MPDTTARKHSEQLGRAVREAWAEWARGQPAQARQAITREDTHD